MQRFWLDTEFNGFGGEFISAALVSDDGNHWYQAVDCRNPSTWTEEQVIQKLNVKPVALAELQLTLHVFLSKFDDIVIIADWPSDIGYFCNLLSVRPYNGKIISVPTITFQLKTWLNGKGKSSLPHNALEDARAIMRYDLFLESLEE